MEGADVLYHADGIIRRSEENAAELFGTARTLYSAEGSSLCIRAMLYLTVQPEKLIFRIAFYKIANRSIHCPAAFLKNSIILRIQAFRSLQHEFTFYHYMIDLSGGPCIYKRISGCGSGTEYMAVTPWGDLYPCHQFVGEEAFKLGDVWQGVTAPHSY